MLQRLRTVVMWNSAAGSSRQAQGVRKQLEQMPGVEFREPQTRDTAIEAVLEACAEGVELVVAAGGDGTVSAIVEGLMRSEPRAALGILPLGTGNDLARSLQVPQYPEGALGLLRSGTLRTIDAVNFTSTRGSRWCANMLTGGNTGRYIDQLTDEVKQRWGPFCYLRGVVDVIRDLQSYRIAVEFDDGPAESFEALNVFVANGRMSGGGMAVSPEASLNDGLIDVVIIRDGEPTKIAGLTADYLLADYLQHELVAFRRARRLRITSEPALPLTADGDRVGETPVEITIEPEALQVVAPAVVDEW